MTTNPQDSLKALGFTGLEAEIYVTLVSVPSMTAYRIAQVLGKPAANVYKAIESLVSKGGAFVDDSGSKFYRAVPPKELLATASKKLEAELSRAEEALARIAEPVSDERMYELLTREQVYQRAAAMLNHCKEIALLDLFPQPLKLLEEDLSACTKRGVLTAAIIYAPASIAGVRLMLHPDGASVLHRWPGQWLNVVVDGKEHLLCFLAPDGSKVQQAVWSASPYLSWIYHSSLSGEMMSNEMMSAIKRKAKYKELLEITKAFEKIKAFDAPGYRSLVRKFRTDSTAPGNHKVKRRSI